MDELAAALIGFAAGALGGVVGVGGGILFVPALTIFLNQDQVEAEATSLLAIILVSVVGGWRQYRYGNVDLRDALAIGLLSVAGALVGVVIANAVPERILEIAFALLALGIAAQLVRKSWREPPPEPGERSG